MTTEEREIRLLREFRSGLAEPSADRLARIRARLDEPKERARWSVRGLVVPAVAGAAVLAVAIGAGVVAFDGDPGGSAPPAASSSEAPPPDPDKTSSHPDPPAAADHRAAVDLLERFAVGRAATGEALTVPPGKLLYVRGAGSDNASAATREAYRHEMWVDVNGGIVLRIRRTDNGSVTIDVPDPNNPKDNMPAEIEQQRQELAKNGPSLNRPTQEYLTALPTDPDAMLDLLRTTAAPGGGPWSADHAIMDWLRTFLYTNEPLLTPQVRVAIYRAITKLPSIGSSGQPVTVDGRSVYTIGQTERGQRDELLIDAITGRIIGSRSLPNGTDPTFYDLWTHAVVASTTETP
jgi:hypothetical protein